VHTDAALPTPVAAGLGSLSLATAATAEAGELQQPARKRSRWEDAPAAVGMAGAAPPPSHAARTAASGEARFADSDD
jgi:hypothetical protein